MGDRILSLSSFSIFFFFQRAHSWIGYIDGVCLLGVWARSLSDCEISVFELAKRLMRILLHYRSTKSCSLQD